AQPKREEPRTPTLSQHIPKFYFPKGCPKANINVDNIISQIEKTFSTFPNERASLEDMSKVAKSPWQPVRHCSRHGNHIAVAMATTLQSPWQPVRIAVAMATSTTLQSPWQPVRTLQSPWQPVRHCSRHGNQYDIVSTQYVACECPLYWKAPLFYAAGGDRTGYVSVHKFVAMWRKVLQTCHDDAAKFVQLLAKPGCVYLEQEDLIPFLQDVVNTHPHLTFLREASEFHSRYITTVVQRIFYIVNRSWTGRITCAELRKSNFLQDLLSLTTSSILYSRSYAQDICRQSSPTHQDWSDPTAQEPPSAPIE
ncbi:unnamed protein product, partial [Ranitomeya imitator]